MPKKMPDKKKTRDFPAVLFDLDGTLIDSVYEHIHAWREVLSDAGIVLSA
jgi:beta-phosphoglucomutase-like phosphatase (HAD superfamily)